MVKTTNRIKEISTLPLAQANSYIYMQVMPAWPHYHAVVPLQTFNGRTITFFRKFSRNQKPFRRAATELLSDQPAGRQPSAARPFCTHPMDLKQQSGNLWWWCADTVTWFLKKYIAFFTWNYRMKLFHEFSIIVYFLWHLFCTIEYHIVYWM